MPREEIYKAFKELKTFRLLRQRADCFGSYASLEIRIAKLPTACIVRKADAVIVSLALAVMKFGAIAFSRG